MIVNQNTSGRLRLSPSIIILLSIVYGNHDNLPISSLARSLNPLMEVKNVSRW